MSRYQKAKLKYFIKEAAIIIILIAAFIAGVTMICATDEYARERFGDGTCQECGDAKYEAIAVDCNGYTCYECPNCYDITKVKRF